MRITRADYSPSCEGTQRPRPARATRKAALDESDVSSKAKNAGSMLAVPQKHPRRKICENSQEHELTTSGEPDDGKAIKSGSVGGTRKPTGAILQGGGCLPYDIGVLYIFVSGEYVGEAYCPELMGSRTSEWEARSMRKRDEQERRLAREQGLPVLARIQDEAKASRRRRSTEIRQVEQAHQWDRQRGEIHPAEVVEHLANIEAEKRAKPLLSKAVPDADDDRPVRVLPVRKM